VACEDGGVSRDGRRRRKLQPQLDSEPAASRCLGFGCGGGAPLNSDVAAGRDDAQDSHLLRGGGQRRAVSLDVLRGGWKGRKEGGDRRGVTRAMLMASGRTWEEAGLAVCACGAWE
jgi:hypothetical protein